MRDYDLMLSPLLANVRVGGTNTAIVVVGGKMGKVFAYRAADGRRLWTRSVGRHQNDVGPLPRKTVTVFPGGLGGVETPMALAVGRIFVPWLDLPNRLSATGFGSGRRGSHGRGGLTAVDAATGRTLWEHKLPNQDFGAATVANDVVFTSTFDGTVYAFDAASGKTLWTARARAGINGFPAVYGSTLLVPAGAKASFKQPKFELIAYSLGGR